MLEVGNPHQYQGNGMVSLRHKAHFMGCRRLRMPIMRKDDAKEGTHFRSRKRVFCQNGKWYFQTRELDHGPFTSRGVAAAELERYINEMDFFSDVKTAIEPPPKPASPDWQLTDFDDQ